jgi:hypothetical protein
MHPVMLKDPAHSPIPPDPAASQSPIQGACHCGSVRIEAAGPLRPPINCHCRLCRSLGGSAFTTWISVKRAALRISGESALTSYRPSANTEKMFCARCGTHVLTTDLRNGAIAGIPAGVFQDADVAAPRADYFVSHKACWHAVPPGSECFGGESGFDPIDAGCRAAPVPSQPGPA